MKTLSMIAVALLLAGCAGPKQETAGTSGATTAQPGAPAPVYVDVRTDSEFASGHVVGAIHIPLDMIAERSGELEKYRDSSMVVYCRSGRRSGQAIDVLKEKGFTKLENGGGLDDLEGKGVAVE